MKTSQSSSPGAPNADPAAQTGLSSAPENTSMTEADYAQLVSALSTATGLLSTRGELNAADLRMRSLVSIAEKEAKRALLDARSRRRLVDAENQTSLAT
jgi:hypothetical protein